MSASRYYLEKIDAAIETAPVLASSDTFSSSYLASFRDAPDNFVFTTNDTWQIGLGEAIIEDPDEFIPLYVALESRSGLVFAPSSVARTVRHEKSHAAAAKKLGCEIELFGISLHLTNEPDPNTESQITERYPFFVPINFTTSKLGHALMFGHPVDPSPADIVNIKDLGFSGINQLGNLAIAHNLAHGFELPVPLCYSMDNGHVEIDLNDEFEEEA